MIRKTNSFLFLFLLFLFPTLSHAQLSGFYPYMKVSNSQSSGTNGGTATTGSWQTMPLNTIDIDTSNILGGSISGSTLSLPAGTYIVNASQPFFQTRSSQIRIYNSTDSATLWNGSSVYAVDSAGEMNSVITGGQFTLSATKSVILQYRVSLSSGSSDLGEGTGFGTEVYAQLELWKIK